MPFHLLSVIYIQRPLQSLEWLRMWLILKSNQISPVCSKPPIDWSYKGIARTNKPIVFRRPWQAFVDVPVETQQQESLSQTSWQPHSQPKNPVVPGYQGHRRPVGQSSFLRFETLRHESGSVHQLEWLCMLRAATIRKKRKENWNKLNCSIYHSLRFYPVY